MTAPYTPQPEQPTTDVHAKLTAAKRRRWPLAILSVVVLGFIGASIGTCAASGDKATPTAAATTSARNWPPPETTPAESAPAAEPAAVEYAPVAKDFKLTIKTLTKQCFGSAGCNVTYRVELGYTGPDLNPDTTYEVTYEVKGAEDPIIGTLTVTGDEYERPSEELASTKSSKAKLTVTVTDVSEQ
jgi:hypothetical protein